MFADKLDVHAHIITGVTSFMQNIDKCIKKADLELEPDGFIVEILASSRTVVSDQEKEVGMMLIDIGGGTTDFAIFKEGSVIQTGVVPVGGNHLTYDIAVALKVPLVEAERLKVNYGCSLSENIDEDEKLEVVSFTQKGDVNISRKMLCQIQEARLTEIFELLKKQIDRAASNSIYIASATLIGGSSHSKDIVDLASGILELPVKIGYPENLMGLSDVVKGPEFCAAVGLLYYGFEKRKNVNSNIGIMKKPKNYLQKVVNWLGEIF